MADIGAAQHQISRRIGMGPTSTHNKNGIKVRGRRSQFGQRFMGCSRASCPFVGNICRAESLGEKRATDGPPQTHMSSLFLFNDINGLTEKYACGRRTGSAARPVHCSTVADCDRSVGVDHRLRLGKSL